MERQRVSPRKKKTVKPVSENEYSPSDDDNKVLVKGTNRTKKQSKRTLDKKVRSNAESGDIESSSEEDISVISKNHDKKKRAKIQTSDKHDSTLSKGDKKQSKVEDLNLSDASSDDIFAPSKSHKEKNIVAISNNAFDSLLSQNNEDHILKVKAMVLDSAEKNSSGNSPRKQRKVHAGSHAGDSSSEDDSAQKKHDKTKITTATKKQSERSPIEKVKSDAESSKSHSSSDVDSLPGKNRDKKNRATQSSEESDSNTVKDASKKEKISEKRKAPGSDSVKTSQSKSKNDKATKKLSERSRSNKVESYAESSEGHSSDEEDSLPAKNRDKKNRATQSSEESDSNAVKGKSKKEMISNKRNAPGSDINSNVEFVHQESSELISVIEKRCDIEKTFSDEESSSGLPDIEKVFETLEVETSHKDHNKLFLAEQESGSPSRTKMSPQKKEDLTESIKKKEKAILAGKNSELNKPSPKKDKKSDHSHPKHDKPSISTSEENDSAVSEDVKKDETDTPVFDIEVKKAGRGRPKKPPSHSNSSSDKASSADGGNAPSKGEKNRSEKQTVSDFGVKKLERGSPRKSKSLVVLEQNGKLPSKDNLISEAESSSSRSKGDEVEQNKSRRQSTEETRIETSNTVKKTASNPHGKLTTNTKSSAVYAVKSKPSPKKRKNDESEAKSKTRKKTEKCLDVRKSSRADTKANTNPVSDKNGSPATESGPKDFGGTTNTNRRGEKKKPIYTTSSDDSDSEEISPKAAEAEAKNKKVKREFSCHKCDAKFARTQQLFDHICKGKKDKGFACEHCDKIYKLRSTYVNHKIIHSRKKPYKCGLCGKKSSSQSNHLYHMKHSHPERKPFPCEFFPCEKSFMTRIEQMDHQKRRHKRFICRYCDEEFTKNSSLLHHRHKVHEVFFS